MSKGKLLAVCVVWLALCGIGAALWRLVVTPAVEEKAQARAQQAEEQAMAATSGDLPYKDQVTIALDSFSGYAMLRSKRFSQLLRQKQIKLNLVDDNADYTKRLASLKDGRVNMAAFTVDALIKTSAVSGQTPATIVALIDETRGADAMLAYKSVINNVDDLNHPETQFVLTPDSPSETLARVVMSNFKLDQLPANPFIGAGDAEDVYQRYRKSQKNSRQIFVLWEPYVSKILANKSMHVVVDSSRFTGYIVDCLVADRDFLVKNSDVAKQVVEAYFRAMYEYRETEKMEQLVRADAGEDSAGGDSMDQATASKLVSGIAWKNTQENFAHFGLRKTNSVQHLADIIDNITSVLQRTGAIDSDPTNGQPNKLYFDGLLRQLHENDFHPGTEGEREQIQESVALAPLTERQWNTLQPVGTLSVPTLEFARGRDALSGRSKHILDELVQQLNTWPQYYVIIRGNASRRGDLEANKALAKQRASAAERYLTSHGVAAQRIHAVGSQPSGSSSVSFLLGQQPY